MAYFTQVARLLINTTAKLCLSAKMEIYGWKWTVLAIMTQTDINHMSGLGDAFIQTININIHVIILQINMWQKTINLLLEGKYLLFTISNESVLLWDIMYVMCMSFGVCPGLEM